jgi:hypothetical protein
VTVFVDMNAQNQRTQSYADFVQPAQPNRGGLSSMISPAKISSIINNQNNKHSVFPANLPDPTAFHGTQSKKMGSGSSKTASSAAKTASKISATPRKYPTRPPPPSSNRTNAQPTQPPAGEKVGPRVHPQAGAARGATEARDRGTLCLNI